MISDYIAQINSALTFLSYQCPEWPQKSIAEIGELLVVHGKVPGSISPTRFIAMIRSVLKNGPTEQLKKASEASMKNPNFENALTIDVMKCLKPDTKLVIMKDIIQSAEVVQFQRLDDKTFWFLDPPNKYTKNETLRDRFYTDTGMEPYSGPDHNAHGIRRGWNNLNRAYLVDQVVPVGNYKISDFEWNGSTMQLKDTILTLDQAISKNGIYKVTDSARFYMIVQNNQKFVYDGETLAVFDSYWNPFFSSKKFEKMPDDFHIQVKF